MTASLILFPLRKDTPGGANFNSELTRCGEVLDVVGRDHLGATVDRCFKNHLVVRVMQQWPVSGMYPSEIGEAGEVDQEVVDLFRRRMMDCNLSGPR